MHQQVPCTRKKMISLGSRLIACCKLAPTLARQMWRHNYVIDRSEYLIFTFSESTNPWVYSLQFLFKSTNNSWRYERKCEWVFFFWTQCIFAVIFLFFQCILSFLKVGCEYGCLCRTSMKLNGEASHHVWYSNRFLERIDDKWVYPRQ